MTSLLSDGLTHSAVDEWAMSFFRAMLRESLSVANFEDAVDARWRGRDFIIRAPRTAAWLHQLAVTGEWNEAGYAHAAPELADLLLRLDLGVRRGVEVRFYAFLYPGMGKTGFAVAAFDDWRVRGPAFAESPRVLFRYDPIGITYLEPV